ncbi:MAG: DUF167 domain-containing protein [Rickettsiales bacterium]|nr:DUF167 domain-containing protein [Rickettsiales bacterium]
MSEIILPLWVKPKAANNAIHGWESDSNNQRWLKLSVTAAPEDGKANKAVITFLSKTWNIPKSALHIVSGDTSRYKRLKITNGYHVPTDYDDAGIASSV